VAPHKCQLELLLRAQEWHREGLRFQLNFIGDMDVNSRYGRDFLEAVRASERAGWACYLGKRSTEEIIQCMDGAQALVHTPSEESFGLVVAEALARNRRVFGFATGGVPDAAADAPGAELVATGDWNGLREKLYRWLEARAPAAAPARALMEARFHPQRVATEHLRVYRQLGARAARA
jgi:glycosyltransferase involved in cell wall biosynthesis